MGDTLVSVLMITFNHEKYIAQAIDSVLMQKTNFGYEIVIGEDCSTDRTREIVLSYKWKYPDKIKLILQKENVGMNQNFIDTLKACTGKYIALLEGDDYWTDPYKLQRQVDFLEANPEYVLTFHKISILYPDGKLVESHCYEKNTFTIDDLIKANFVPTCSVVFRNVDLEIPEFYRNFKIGDYPLYFQLIKHGKFYYLDFNMSTYRVHDGGVFSLKDDLHKYNSVLEVYGFYREHMPDYKRKFDKSIIKMHYAMALNLKKNGKNKDAYAAIKKMYSFFPGIIYSEYYLKAFIKIILGLKIK